MNEQALYWREYFESRFAADGLDTVRRLDYSNEGVRQQTYASLLEATGAVHGFNVLDAGCGNGELARLCDCLGGKATGLDVNRVVIDQLRGRYPQIDWQAAPLGDAAFLTARRGHFHCVICSEVLQYVETAAILPWLWELVAPGGRLVLMVPNQHCPIIQRVEQRFPGNYKAWPLEKWRDELSRLSSVAVLWTRELAFADDQRLQPYLTSPWRNAAGGDVSSESVPNRLQWVLQKSRPPGDS